MSKIDAEVGVVGVGTMGSMAMWQLARSGVSVIGFEQLGTGHDVSGAGGESRIFRTAYKEGPEYVPILQDAYAEWRELEKETGNKLLTINNGLMIGEPGSDYIKNVMKGIETYGLDHEILDKETAGKRYPQHRLMENEIMIVDKQAGFLRPEYAVVSAIQRAEELGAVVHRRSRVEEIIPGSDGVKIHADGKEYHVGKVIIAAGPWAGNFLPSIEKNLIIKRIIMTWFPPKDIEKFSVDKFPIFMRRTEDVEFFGTPTLEGTMVKVSLGAVSEEVSSPENLNKSLDSMDLTRIRSVVSEFLPDLYPEPVRVSAYMDLYTSDKHPLVGNLPDFQNTIILSGFSGHGFKMAPIMGKIAASLAVDGKTKYPIEQFNPARFMNK